MEPSLLEILTYYVIGGALLVGAPGVFFLLSLCLLCRILKAEWLVTVTTKNMVIFHLTKILRVIKPNFILKLVDDT